MAEATDVLTLEEAKLALNIEQSDTSQDTELTFLVTAVSQRLDDLCGAIVKRTVTDEQYTGGGTSIFLRHAPASATATTTISTVKEYSGGTLTTLTAEALTTSTASDYSFDARLGVLTRRSTWSDVAFGTQRVVVTYSPGRFASTDLVDKRFKEAAKAYLQTIWESGQGVQGSVTYGPTDDTSVGGSNFALAESRAKLLLQDELKPPGVG